MLDVLCRLLKIQRPGRGSKKTFCMSEYKEDETMMENPECKECFSDTYTILY